MVPRLEVKNVPFPLQLDKLDKNEEKVAGAEMALIDSRGRLLLASEGFRQLIQEGKGRREELPAVFGLLVQHLLKKSEKKKTLTVRWQRGNGSALPLTVSLLPAGFGQLPLFLLLVHGEDGKLPAVPAEEENEGKKENAAFFPLQPVQAAVFDALGVGLLIFDADFKLSAINDAGVEFFGAAKDALVGIHAEDIFSRIKKEKGEEFRLFRQKGWWPWKSEIYLSEKKKAYDLTVAPVYDNEGGVLCYYGLLQDITEVKKKEEILCEQEKLASLSYLAAGLAHEIRNPLTTIRGFVQILKSRLVNELENEYLDIILQELDRTTALVGDMLMLARPRPGEYLVFDLLPLVENVVEFMRPQAILAEIELEYAHHAESLKVRAVEDQIKQVLINIIRNAVEAIEGKGRILVETGREVVENRVMARVQVTDTGQGIPEESLEKVFEVFYTTKQGGSGFGLPLCRRILEEHGGRIVIHSRVGEGTTVSVYLPLAEDKQV
ncbi:MAG: two-component system, sporulation sensor kinase [Eubacteriales bacterium]|nr:two-component system, sporulation sensor kinase [Eubacteriales bacterium]MDN5364279.1 two-component system, sporulation sensor kinase [Eubacteriales bacterium]